ncbi:MAG: hypothetical protein ACRDGS_09480 [Chloroflexota bacterium]
MPRINLPRGRSPTRRKSARLLGLALVGGFAFKGKSGWCTQLPPLIQAGVLVISLAWAWRALPRERAFLSKRVGR